MSDKYIKIKDNGSSGLALVRVEAEDVAEEVGVTDLKNVLSAEDWIINSENNYINYGYDTPGHRNPVAGASDSTAYGFDRAGQTIVLDGSGESVTSAVVVKLSGDVATAKSSGVYPTWTASVPLKLGHTYEFTLRLLSGTSSAEIQVVLYKQGSSSTLGTASGWVDGVYRRQVVGDGDPVRVCLYISKNTVFSAAKYIILMQDITVVPNDEFAYLDYKANKALSLIDYGYGTDVTDLAEDASATSSGSAVGVKRLGSFVTLNFAGSGSVKRVKVSGSIGRVSGSTTYKNWTGDILLEAGAQYRYAIRKISGTSMLSNAVMLPGLVVYEPNGSTSIATEETSDTDPVKRSFVFTAPNTLITLAIYINAALVLDDALFDITLEKISGYGIEDYYASEMSDTIQKVRGEITSPAVVFPWVTDIHRYTASVQTFPDMINNMIAFAKNVKCDLVLNTGDTIEGNKAQAVSLGYAYDCIADFKNIGEPLCYAQGNHDNNPYTQSGALSFTLPQVYSGFFASTKGVSFNASENGTDYYVDVDGLGVRLIVLNACNSSVSNTYAFGNSTAEWLSGVLDTDKHIILASHVSPVSDHVWSNNSPTNKDGIRNALVSFVESGGKLVLLTGHSHIDAEFINPFVEVTDVCQKFEKANISATGYQQISGYIDGIRNPDRVAYSSTADAWSVVVYKPLSEELSVIRFGAGVDRYIHCGAVAPGTLISRFADATWSSSDTSVATVADGVVTGVAVGKCAVIAKDTNGNVEAWVINVT